ncbi:LANO_0H20736g1_1 [Lachancea nothofagi CBS 11611]|uniref:LANO_0H20736g1_1 n=1 Tax=Lachancea nothofagi CBS 11611 TaxID=1266666 RepID=A0A1G4KNA0_9SACH|nr:LANO_0H20736g1_1 [Lachancea nothofagi CBS 11611]
MFNFGNTGANAGNAANNGSIFGSKPATTTTGFSGGLNNGNPQGQSSGMQFGQNNAQQNSGGLLGQFNTGTTGSGGLFGNKPSGGLTFGQNSNQQQQSAAQNPSQSGSLFGNSNQQSSGAGSGGLFGSNNQQSSGTGSGSLFGNSNQQSSGAGSSGLFGNNNQQQTNSTSGGLFGSNNQQQTNNTSGGLFGNKPSVGTTGGLLGNSSNNNTNTTATGGLFGNNTQTQQQGFNSGPQFGTQAQQQPQGNSLFGNTGTVSSTQPSFGWSQPSNNQNANQQQNQSQLQQQQQQQQMQIQQQQMQQVQQSNYPQQIQEQIVKCKESWNPQFSRSKLRTFFYNKVNETEAMLYNKPPGVSQEDWDEALLHKPSPSVIPVQAFGFDDLNQRNILQRDNVAQARLILNQILEKLTQLSQKHDLDTASRILKAQSRNVQIQQRIIKLGSYLAILKSKGLPLSVGEEKMWSEFEKLLKRSNDPAGLGKNNELWARLSVLKERSKTISDQLDSTLVAISEKNGFDAQSNTSSRHDDKRVDEEVENRVNKIAEILSNQQRGLCYLRDVLDKDEKAVDKYVS